MKCSSAVYKCLPSLRLRVPHPHPSTLELGDQPCANGLTGTLAVQSRRSSDVLTSSVVFHAAVGRSPWKPRPTQAPTPTPQLGREFIILYSITEESRLCERNTYTAH